MTVVQVPLVPVQEGGAAVEFWNTVRTGYAAAGVEIHRGIRADQEEEQRRWQHLVPGMEKNRSIREYWAGGENENAAVRLAGPGIR